MKYILTLIHINNQSSNSVLLYNLIFIFESSYQEISEIFSPTKAILKINLITGFHLFRESKFSGLMQCLDAVALGVRSSVVYQGVKHAAANLGSPYTVSERTCYNVLLAHKATDVVLSPLGTTDLKSIKL